MSPTRRDLLKIAAGLGLTGAVPTTAERIAAAEALNVPPITDHEWFDDNVDTLTNPAEFAIEMDGWVSGNIDGWLEAVCPYDHAAEKKALADLYAAYPDIARAGITPLSQYQEAAFNLSGALYVVGLKHGAAFENLRRSIVGEVTTCRPCRSIGITKDGEACTLCGGTGTVAVGTEGNHYRHYG